MQIANSYEDAKRAEAYSALEFPGTYYLAYRDLPEIIFTHVKGREALDFGCGTGRSTRFIRKFGFNVVGVDISPDMLKKAGELDPMGDYRLIDDGDLGKFEDNTCDLVLSAFTFDNIPQEETKVKILREIRRILSTDGRFVNLISTPDMYVNEWASFSTKDFPENGQAKSGDLVKIINTDIADSRPVEDILWTDESYRNIYKRTGLELEKTYRPLAREDEPHQWVNETRIPPWAIYVLRKV